MKIQVQAFIAEVLKLRHSPIIWITFLAFALAPIMGGIFMMIMNNPGALEKSGAFATKVKAMNLTAEWFSYFGILTQAIGIGGVLIFGFVASWLFGREYSDGTTKDLLALPTSKTKILNAKFILYVMWCFFLTISNLIVGFLIGTILQLPLLLPVQLTDLIFDYIVTTGLTILLGSPIAFFALWGKGYMAPLGFVALTLVFSQIIAATGYGYYFPWAIPGLYSGAGGEFKDQLNILSYLILIIVSILGYLASILYWNHTDHTK